MKVMMMLICLQHQVLLVQQEMRLCWALGVL
jgi:hypothetical protein